MKPRAVAKAEPVAPPLPVEWNHRAARLAEGLTAGHEGRLFGVGGRSVQRWDSGERPIPPIVRRLLDCLRIEREAGGSWLRETLQAMADAEADDGEPDAGEES